MDQTDEFATWDCPNCPAAVWIGRDECWHCSAPRPS